MIPIEEIRELTHRDRKTRVQAALKLVEELGELARLALLEKLNLSDEDLEPWVRRKMVKWNRALEGKLLPK